MKPGDHPQFFRLPPPSGTSRESTIRLDREGRFWHDGEIVEHASLARAFATWIARHPDDGRLILTNGYDWTYFTADDAPYFVDALRIESDGAILCLFDGSEEPLDPGTLSVGEDGVVYARVKGGTFEARFTRHAQTALAPLLTSADPPTVTLRGDDYVLGSRVVRPSSGAAKAG
jgi:hypothetical protein